ncbi:MAG: YwaF family protein [Lachnospiraceae bacterium]|nr:YwaF family protein [Lachnospiraceae bacterium]
MITTIIEPIKQYSIYHLLICLGIVVVAAVLVHFLKKLDKVAVITAMGILLVANEVMKQVFMQQIYASYSWSDVPFQLCSVPMYLCLLYPFIKKLRGVIENFLRSFGLLGAIVAFAIPCDVFSKYLMLSIQSTLWHAILFILGVYCIAITPADKKLGIKEYRNNAILYLILALMAMGINTVLMKPSAGTVNMFFLGPGKPYMVIVNDIYDKFGWQFESIAMILCSEAAGALVLFLGELARKLIFRKKEQVEKK